MLSSGFLGGKLDAHTNVLARMHDVISKLAGKRGECFTGHWQTSVCFHKTRLSQLAVN